MTNKKRLKYPLVGVSLSTMLLLSTMTIPSAFAVNNNFHLTNDKLAASQLNTENDKVGSQIGDENQNLIAGLYSFTKAIKIIDPTNHIFKLDEKANKQLAAFKKANPDKAIDSNKFKIFMPVTEILKDKRYQECADTPPASGDPSKESQKHMTKNQTITCLVNIWQEDKTLLKNKKDKLIKLQNIEEFKAVESFEDMIKVVSYSLPWSYKIKGENGKEKLIFELILENQSFIFSPDGVLERNTTANTNSVNALKNLKSNDVGIDVPDTSFSGSGGSTSNPSNHPTPPSAPSEGGGLQPSDEEAQAAEAWLSTNDRKKFAALKAAFDEWVSNPVVGDFVNTMNPVLKNQEVNLLMNMVKGDAEKYKNVKWLSYLPYVRGFQTSPYQKLAVNDFKKDIVKRFEINNDPNHLKDLANLKGILNYVKVPCISPDTKTATVEGRVSNEAPFLFEFSNYNPNGLTINQLTKESRVYHPGDTVKITYNLVGKKWVPQTMFAVMNKTEDIANVLKINNKQGLASFLAKFKDVDIKTLRKEDIKNFRLTEADIAKIKELVANIDTGELFSQVQIVDPSYYNLDLVNASCKPLPKEATVLGAKNQAKVTNASAPKENLAKTGMNLASMITIPLAALLLGLGAFITHRRKVKLQSEE